MASFKIPSALATFFNSISYPFIWIWNNVFKALANWIVGANKVSPKKVTPHHAVVNDASSEPIQTATEPVQADLEPIQANTEPVQAIQADIEPVQADIEPVHADVEPVQNALSSKASVPTAKKSPKLDPLSIPSSYRRFFMENEWLINGDIFNYIVELSEHYPNLYCPPGSQRDLITMRDYRFKTTPVYPAGATAEEKLQINKVLIEEAHKSHHLFKLIKTQLSSNIEQPDSKQVFAYPIRLVENHWALVLIDRKKRTLEYYNSMPSYGDSYLDTTGHKHFYSADTIMQNLRTFTADLNEIDPSKEGEKPYEFLFKTPNKLQFDGHQCGVWTLYFLEQRLKNPESNFTKLSPIPDMATLRLEIGERLIESTKPKHNGFKF